MLILWAFLIVAFVSLVLLPRGRPAAIGIGVAVLALVALWATSNDGSDIVFIALSGMGVALAAVAQAVRWAFGPQMSKSTYLLFALGLLLSVLSLGLYVLVR